ncbi:hypothetical protein [Clostridium sp.]|uniref:hypothetical protein n=1 Tax=Clostridium sp. TaxID=1506 RepID=UPI001A3B568A|nr:hypothetical protein [Clostridium sp.]MBK5240833.1 hypothetical protein [Clostridium sp.]
MNEEKHIVNAHRSRKKFRIILFLSIVIVSIGIFATSYYTSINKVYNSYEDSLLNNMNDITKVNKTIATFNSNQTIDVDYAKEKLPNIIESLSTLRAQLWASEPASKYENQYENLMFGLDNNLLMYRRALVILSNPSSSDVDVSIENLKTYRDDCIDFYTTINIADTKITLPQTSLSFIDNLLNYSYSAFMIKKEADIKYLQVQDFINKIDILTKDFSDIKTNYYSYAIKVRKNEMQYNELLSLIQDNSTKLNSLNTKFNKNFSVPSPAIPTYETFRPLFQIYESYLSDFKLALTNEKIQTLSMGVDSTTLDPLYDSSNAKFVEVENSYNNFIKVCTDLRNYK